MCLFWSFSLSAAEPKSILFIGNSYTEGMRGTFKALLKHEKIGAHVEFICPGGRQLIQHSQNKDVLKKLRSRKWDFVVLQDQSQTPAYPNLKEKFFAGAKALDKVIKEQGAKTVFYMTWGRRDGDKRNAQLAPDYAKMQNLLTASYLKATADLKARLSPCGMIWQEVKRNDGILWKRFYRGDGSHPSEHGAYLISLSFYCVLFDKRPEQLRFSGVLNSGEKKVIVAASKKIFDSLK